MTKELENLARILRDPLSGLTWDNRTMAANAIDNLTATRAEALSRTGAVKALLDPDMPAQELRLHMGEMSAQEMRTARAAIRWANTRLSTLEPAAPEGQQEPVAEDGDREETVERNPKSWIAWKREAERLGELAKARGFSELTDEWIIELAVTHSNYKEGAGFEVFSHTRIVEFARALLTLTRPSEQAVTEASRAMLEAIDAELDTDSRSAAFLGRVTRLRAALKAAMEAGRHG